MQEILTSPQTVSQTGSALRVGIVGAGHISEFHLRALERVKAATVVGVTDLDRSRADALAAQFKVPRAFASLDELLDHRADVIHVLTPPSSHAQLTIQSLQAGCHVLVEKPMATSIDECDMILDAAERESRIVCVDHAMLRDPFVVRALDIVASGKIGDVVSVDYFKSQKNPPYIGGPLPVYYRDGGYPFRDVGVHALYLIQRLLGEIKEVTGQFRKGDEDPLLLYPDWRALVRCQRGTGQVHLTWNTKPYQNLLTIQGTHGVVRADLSGMSVTVKRSRRLPGFVERIANANGEGWQIATQVPINLLQAVCGRIRRYHGVQLLVSDFYESLAVGAPPPASADEARPIVNWTERIARQADQAKRVWVARFPANLTAPVLVTGGTGFIGRHLLRRLLANNERIRLLTRREPPAEWMNDPRVEVVLGDLGDPVTVERAVADADLIYHLGAGIKGSVADIDRGTIVGTRNVVTSAVAHQSRVVYVSSLSVLHAAAAHPGQVVREDWALEPHPDKRGHYTRTKSKAEGIVREAVEQQKLKAVILRPGQVFGPGGPLITPAIGLRRGDRLIVLGNGKITLPLIYVEDLVDAIIHASECDTFEGSVFHLVDPKRMTQNELIARYQELSRDFAKVFRMPRLAVNVSALGIQLLAAALRRAAPLSPYRVRSALAPWVFDCSAAREQLGWEPRIGLDAGLKKTLEDAEPSGASQPKPNMQPVTCAQ